MRGFTLIETIIYIGLFSIMSTGIFISIYPLFTNAERLSKNILREGETMFLLNKIQYAITQSITSSHGVINEPVEGASSDTLVITSVSGETFMFTHDASNIFCTPPRHCNIITYEENGATSSPLNNERVSIEHFNVVHKASTASTSRRLEVSFTANDIPIGPVTYFPHF